VPQRRRRDHDRGRDERARGRDRLDAAADEQALEAGEERPRVRPPGPAAPVLGRLLAQGLGERAPGAEQERLDRGGREAELDRDLLVREPLPLAKEDRPPLLLRERAQRLIESEQVVDVVLAGGDDVLELAEVARRFDPAPARGRAPLVVADVLRDLEQPRRLVLQRDAAIEPAERVQERDLRRVLGRVPAAEPLRAEVEDPPAVAGVQLADRDGGVAAGPGGREQRRPDLGRRDGYVLVPFSTAGVPAPSPARITQFVAVPEAKANA
jgi:hypothetical protein